MNSRHIFPETTGKVFAGLLAVALAMMPGRLPAQDDKIISFPSRTVTVAEAIAAIEEQTPYLVSVNLTDFDTSAKADLGANEVRLGTALRKVLDGTGRDFVIRGEYILIVNAKPVPEPAGIRPEPPRKPKPPEKTPERTVNVAEQSVVTAPAEPPVAVSELPQPEPIPEPDPVSAEEAAAIRRRVAAGALPAPTSSGPMRFAVKANLLYGAGTLTPNLGLEFGLGRRSTLDVAAGYNPWNMNGTDANNRKLGHWIVQPEYRRWLCERFNGHFFGVHVFGGQFNISEHRIPLLFREKDSDLYRYDGWMAGAGVSYGYQLMLGKKWNLEFNIGAGYGFMKYDRYEHRHCGDLIERNAVRHYFGPTKAGVTLMFLIK